MNTAQWLDYTLSFRTAWQSARGGRAERRGRLLRLQDDAGRCGWGDCAPLPEAGITSDAAQAFAEECALLDLAAQRAGLPLHAYLSGEATVSDLAVNVVGGSLFTVDADQLAHFADAGERIVKLKVGIAPVDSEIARLRFLVDHLPAGLTLRLDANCRWSPADARRFLAACADLPVDGLEEPLADPRPELLAELQASVPFPLAIDESIARLGARFLQPPPVRRLIIKPARHGLLASMALGLHARASGLEVVVTSALESACGVMACAQLAAAIAPHGTHGLATGDGFVNDLAPWPRQAGRLLLPNRAGIGFTPSSAPGTGWPGG